MFVMTLKNGFISGFKCFWFLMKIIIPVYFVVTVVKYTPIMDMLITAFKPIMGIFHMPGEAAVPIITGVFLDEYSAIAAIKVMSLSGFTVSIVAIMNLMAHSLVVEAAILKKMDLSIVFFTSYRVLAAAAVGIIFSAMGVLFGLW